MNIIGVDDKKAIVTMLEKMFEKIDPDGEHRFYTDPSDAINDLGKPVEVAFLDVEMPGMDGIELAKRINERYPLCNIIFLTGYPEYAPTAFDIHASGYIVKPFSQKKLEDALAHLRYRTPEFPDKPVRVQCFGTFEVFVNGEPVKFARQKSKELFAFLVDRRGAMCDMDMLIGNIEPEAAVDRSEKSKIRVYLSDLTAAFEKLGIEGLVVRNTGTVGVNVNMLDCDYYRFLNNDPFVVSKYTGEYMSQYDFAKETRAFLEMKFRKQ